MTAWVDPRNAGPSQVVEAVGWEPPLDRLEAECQTALRHGRADPWATTEVECWLDLLDAEIAAARHRRDPTSIGLLGSWRDRLESIRARLANCTQAA
jgi:hypothetical protein